MSCFCTFNSHSQYPNNSNTYTLIENVDNHNIYWHFFKEANHDVNMEPVLRVIHKSWQDLDTAIAKTDGCDNLCQINLFKFRF